MGHNGDSRGNAAIEFIEASHEVHIPTDEKQFLWKVYCILHDLFYAALHLQLHLDNV